MRRFALGLLTVVTLAACRGAPRTDADVVARAGPDSLTVARLATIAAAATDLPLRSDLVEGLAMRWVGYSLLAQRAAAGDRLDDRETILALAWPDVRAAVIDSFRTARLAGRVRVTPAQVDSAYGDPGLRYLRLVLKRTGPAMPASQRDSQRAVLEGIRARLAAGGPWDSANAQNDDPRSRAQGGSLGLVSRGQLVSALERVGFGLAPGQLSSIVETSAGFELLYRPKLEDARDGIAAALRERLAVPYDSAYVTGLLATGRVTMVAGAPAAVRYAIASAVHARGSDLALALYQGGRFTVGELVLYLQYLPVDFLEQVQQAPDTQLVQLIRSFVVRELEWRDAVGARITVPEQAYRQLAAGYGQQLGRILTVTGLHPDSLAAMASSRQQRQRMAARIVDRFFGPGAGDAGLPPPLPPGLVNYLLDRGEWTVSPRAVEKTALVAAMLRDAESTGAARRP